MKKKLMALLSFFVSEKVKVEASLSDVNRDNYRQYLCDDSIFAPTTPIVSEGSRDPKAEEIQRSNLLLSRDLYCYDKDKYHEALETKNNHEGLAESKHWCTGDEGVYLTHDQCVNARGLTYAYSCERLRMARKDTPNIWNDVVATLPRPRCNIGNR